MVSVVWLQEKGLIIAARAAQAQQQRADGRQSVRFPLPVTPQALDQGLARRDGDTPNALPPEGWVNKSTPDVYLADRPECRLPRPTEPVLQKKRDHRRSARHALPYRLQRHPADRAPRGAADRPLAPAVPGLRPPQP